MKRKLKKSHLFIILLFCILVFTSVILCMLNRMTKKSQEVETVEKPTPIFVKKSEYELPKKEEVTNLKLVGYLTIEKIGLLSQPVWEGVEDRVLEQGIGHFKDTAVQEGNIGLASHNAGSGANHFARLPSLEVGDLIVWQYNGVKRYYQVIEKQKIDSHDWSKLQQTLNNKMTLITCVSGEPQKRWCIQAIEKEERNE